MRVSVYHQAVLLHEAVGALNLRPGDACLDGTFGRGGHAAAILEALGPRGRLLALDRDPEAEAFARTAFRFDSRLTFVKSGFSRLAEVVEAHGLTGRLQGVLLDLGVSSPQLDEAGRGFGFTRDGPLDMRMDPDAGRTAAEWLAAVTEAELDRVLWRYGEERFHRRIARAIVAARREAPIETTGRLAQIIAAAVPARERGKHPATRSFQAIRIAVNRELEELEAALPQAVEVLAPGGRLVVIAFHSLEDRIVKRFMRDRARGPQLPPDLPVPAAAAAAAGGATLRIAGRAQRPGAAEISANLRARSAVLRVAERL